MSEEKQLQEQPGANQSSVQETPDLAAQNGSVQGSPVQRKNMKRGMQVAIAVVAVLLIGVAGFAAGKIYKAEGCGHQEHDWLLRYEQEGHVWRSGEQGDRHVRGDF